MIAREILVFNQKVRKEDPSKDDCPGICSLNGEELKDYCAVCPVGFADRYMMAECRKHLEKYDVKGEYTLNGILADYNNVRRMMSNFPEGGYDPEWTVITCRMVDIIRREEYRERRIQIYQAEQEANRK